eukprot:2146906-Pleurochrysis_carterae.AAC.1
MRTGTKESDHSIIQAALGQYTTAGAALSLYQHGIYSNTRTQASYATGCMQARSNLQTDFPKGHYYELSGTKPAKSKYLDPALPPRPVCPHPPPPLYTFAPRLTHPSHILSAAHLPDAVVLGARPADSLRLARQLATLRLALGTVAGRLREREGGGARGSGRRGRGGRERKRGRKGEGARERGVPARASGKAQSHARSHEIAYTRMNSLIRPTMSHAERGAREVGTDMRA